MPRYELLQWMAGMTGLLFIFAFGAICGSFINVVVYRIPRGMNVIRPPSACPACGTRLRWTENFPILGWLWLRGKCRFCKSPISPEYVLVELFVACVFALCYALWFMEPSPVKLAGLDPEAWRPEWTEAGLSRMWPMLLIVYALIGSLVAMTLIDAKTFTIPLVIPWFATLVAVVIHPLHAVVFGADAVRHLPDLDTWTIPIPSHRWVCAAYLGVVGMALSIAMLRFGIFPRSFSDYEEWEKGAQASGADGKEPGSSADNGGTSRELRMVLMRVLMLTGPGVALMALGATLGADAGRPLEGMLLGLLVGLVIGIVLRRMVAGPTEHLEPIWVQYPHARREMLKECVFLLPIVGLAWVGWWLGAPGGDMDAIFGQAPLWSRVLGASLLGYLVGGGMIWGIRIVGSLAFGREAMGLGDVHLLAAVGAALGWIDPILVFFLAPPIAILWFVLGAVASRLLKGHGSVLQFGPHLSAATLLVLLFKEPLAGVLQPLTGNPSVLP